MSEKPVVLENVTIHFAEKDRPTIKDVSFSLDEGDFALLLGPSSCGKSVLCQSINNVLENSAPTCRITGKVSLFGRDVTTLPTSQISKQVGIVFQNPDNQICEVLVDDEVAFASANLLVPRQEIIELTDRALEYVGMSHAKGKFTTELSGGEKQRIAIAGALATRLKLLLLDNPTSNLDPQGAAHVLAIIRKISKDEHLTTLLVASREIDDVIAQADKILLLNGNGELIFQGSPRKWIEEKGDFSTKELGIWVPEVAEIAIELRKRGAPIQSIPLTIDEAAEEMKGKIHLDEERIHEAKRGEAYKEGESVVKIEGLHFSYPDGTCALRGIDLEVRRGEIVAIVGQNGAGKTTLSLSIIGVNKPSSGSVITHGMNTKEHGIKEIGSLVGYVFQYPEHQFVETNVLKEVSYNLSLRKIPPNIVKEKAAKILDDLELLEMNDAHPLALSSGEKRRLSTADILIAEPATLILDEPTFGLDRKNSTMILEYIQRLNKEQNMTFVLVTHDMRAVAEYAHRAIVMSDGKLVYSGPTREMFAEDEVLNTASLLPPPVFRLARRLNPKAKILTVDEFLEASSWL
jgi:energy-coupling factor transporter ATP-binding protein EcfA2